MPRPCPRRQFSRMRIRCFTDRACAHEAASAARKYRSCRTIQDSGHKRGDRRPPASSGYRTRTSISHPGHDPRGGVVGALGTKLAVTSEGRSENRSQRTTQTSLCPKRRSGAWAGAMDNGETILGTTMTIGLHGAGPDRSPECQTDLPLPCWRRVAFRELHHHARAWGTLDFTSLPQAGTTFTVTLPVRKWAPDDRNPE